MKKMPFVWTKSVVCAIAVLFALGELPAQVSFDLVDGTAFDNKSAGAFPVSMVSSGITMRALSIAGPTSFEDYPLGTEPANTTQTTFSGLGLDSLCITNVGLTGTFGDDMGSETNSLNILESITVDLDHSVTITALEFRDLEQYEKVTITTGTGVQAVLLGTAAWSKGAGGFVAFSGAQLGSLNGYLLQRGETLTIEFDTVDPLDRVPDGNGNLLNASPSCAWQSVTVATPTNFSLGQPYVVQGSPTEATVGGELWGGSADVTLFWTTDPGTGWPNSRSLGTLSGTLIQGQMDGLSADTVWFFKFVADNGSVTVESPVERFIWATQFFVSPDGDDANDGLSESSPLQTIDGALERIRRMARQPQPEGPVMPNYLTSSTSTYGNALDAHLANLVDPVTVVLLPGWHFLEQPVQIDKTLDGNIHFVGQWSSGAVASLESLLAVHGQDPHWFDLPVDQMPVVSGGVPIDNWTTTTLNGKTVWVAELPDVASGEWEFKQLFVDGRRAIRSRWPKEGWFRMAEVDNESWLDFRVDASDLAGIDIENWTNLQDVETIMLHRWVDDRNKIASYNPETNWISLSPPRPEYDLFGSHPSHEAGFAAYYFENVFETLSEPGEFYLDRQTGRLYYMPLAGQTPANTEVIAPRLRELVSIVGKPANDGVNQQNIRLWNVTFKNIGFAHTLTGYLDDHVGTGNNATNSANAAIRYIYARKGKIEGCFFGHLGEYAIELGPETTGFEIGANLFRSLSAGALKSYQMISPQNFEQRTGFHSIHDNDVLGFALFWHGAPAVLCTTNIFMEVEYNLVRNGPFNGINMSGVGSDILRFGHSNVVRKNRIFDVGLGMLSDLAGIYAPGQNPHGIIEGNAVSDIIARDYTSPAVYLDGSAEYWKVRYNWLYRSNTKLVNIKGWTHVIHDNVVAYGANKLLDRRDGDLPSSQSSQFPLLTRGAPQFNRNIYIPLSGAAYSNENYTDAISPWAVSDNNVFWNHGLEPWVFQPDWTLAEFQSLEGKDLNSLVVDPDLVDPLRGDFRIGAIPAEVSVLGITSIDNLDAGVRTAEWLTAGMPDYVRIPALPVDWLPLDVPGLVGWLDAADLDRAGPLPEWKNKLPFSYTMQQFDAAAQPVVLANYVNGNPAVAFDGGAWMANDEFGLEARESIGQFRDRDFTIFTVYRSRGIGTVLLAKGEGGANGNWSIGQTAHAFQWDSTNSIGDSTGAWAVRTWRREGDTFQFFRNGVKVAETNTGTPYAFNMDDHLYLGRLRGSDTGMLDGEVGEILVYLGTPSSADLDAIHAYLLAKWTTQEPIFSSGTIVESNAAFGVAYERTLVAHVLPEWASSSVRFEKVSGPDWLSVSSDGTVTGLPAATDQGANSFTVQAFTQDGNIQTITLEITVQAPDSVSPQHPKGFSIQIISGSVHLQWEPNPEPDFSHYIIYRSEDLTGFSAWVDRVWESEYSEPMGALTRVFFTIEAVDTSGNRSGQ